MAKTVDVYSFEAALKASEGYGLRHILLGNGFSIACRPRIFVYSKLFDRADFSKLSPSAREAFNALNTTDFERVIRSLCDASKIMAAYGVSADIVADVDKDCAALKELLVQTIASSHPALPSEITDAEYTACQAFLGNFKRVYTLNYDLLLYWTQMHHEDEAKITSDDGFRAPFEDTIDDVESDYVVWIPKFSRKQRMFYLHGALHIFDNGTEIQKFTYSRTGVPLIEQISRALNDDNFPVFVAEGTSEEKVERIRHNDYLAKAYHSFEEIQYCLFIHGHSLAPNDEHFLQMIERGRTDHLFIGLHGDPDSDSNKRIIRRAERMISNRRAEQPLAVSYYDSESADVWGHRKAAADAAA
jgi:hypothetical protein